MESDGVNFAVASRYATSVTLVVFMPGNEDAVLEFPLNPRVHVTGDVWHAFLAGIDTGCEYA
ncbi:MAG TPA: hypothetical protein VKM54_29565, partial [Myxococcota bacterium]|nr:hypothetical protein [Myxococcota bacterium]